jgi:hypothetical protein
MWRWRWRAARGDAEQLLWYQRFCRGGRLVALIGLLFARTRQDVSVTAGIRAPFHVVVRKIWPYGLGLALGTVGFGVIATFITLYFSAHRWQGAAFTLSLFSVGFICVRLVAGNMITRYGGVRVSLVCFVVECLGLVIIWLAPSAWIAGLGALLTGSGFSLVFPALGWKRSDRLKNKTRGRRWEPIRPFSIWRWV